MPVRGTIFEKSKSLQLSIPGHSSASQTASTNPCLVRQVPTQLHLLCHCIFQAGFPMCLLFLTPDLNPKQCDISYSKPRATSLHTRPYYGSGGPSVAFQTTWLLHLLSQPILIFKCWPGTSYMSSYSGPHTICYFCQFPHIFYLLLAAMFSHGKCFPWHTDIWDGLSALAMSRVTKCSKSHVDFCLGQQHHYQLDINLLLLWKIS